jgi:hypothetical protein
MVSMMGKHNRNYILFFFLKKKKKKASLYMLNKISGMNVYVNIYIYIYIYDSSMMRKI